MPPAVPATAPAWQPVLDFWFGALTAGMASAHKRQQWFQPDTDFDHRCIAEFGAVLDQARSGAHRDWLNHPHGRLAFIILTDQLTRNIHRGNAQAYAWDDLALAAATEGVQLRAERELAWDERAFFYMPFEHSEDLLDQHLSVGLFTQLRDESPGEIRNLTGNSLRFAHQHRDIILRFGRFPHRNAVLQRPSTAAEASFVAAGNGFGQSL